MPHLADVPPDLDAKEFELEFEHDVRLDVLTTKDPDGTGAIARYLKKSGAGIQQVEIFSKDVDRATEILNTRFGLSPLYPAARAGADGTRVNFFLVAAGPGKKALIEIVEDRAQALGGLRFPLCSIELSHQRRPPGFDGSLPVQRPFRRGSIRKRG